MESLYTLLGNFVSNQRKPKTDGGLMVRVELTKNGDSYKISNAGYYPDLGLLLQSKNTEKSFLFYPVLSLKISQVSSANASDYILMKKFISDSRAAFKQTKH